MQTLTTTTTLNTITRLEILSRALDDLETDATITKTATGWNLQINEYGIWHINENHGPSGYYIDADEGMPTEYTYDPLLNMTPNMEAWEKLTPVQDFLNGTINSIQLQVFEVTKTYGETIDDPGYSKTLDGTAWGAYVLT